MLSNINDWTSFYNAIRGEDWPDCDSEHDVQNLPDWIKLELRASDYDFYRIDSKFWLTGGTKNYKVFYNVDQDGGGTMFGQDYIKILQTRYNRHFDRCYEWCSGPGFIGFSILAHGISSSLCLSDFYYPVIDFVEKTIKENDCEKIVDAYLLKDLKLLPENEKFDLVVSNPPHFEDCNTFYFQGKRITTDQNWLAHKNFFENIKQHLNKDGIILLQESCKGSTIETFQQYIIDAGLKINNCFVSDDYPEYYYIEIIHNENLS
jgi:hypothetical protein